MRRWWARPLVALLALWALVRGCLGGPTLRDLRLAIPNLAPSSQPAGTRAPAVLPRPLYFMSDHGGPMQVWRLECDGVTAAPVTDEASGVTAYDLSRRGELAYATREGLLQVAQPGGQWPRVVADLAGRAASTGTTVTWVSWSPDGERLAYVLHTPREGIPASLAADQVWADDGLWVATATGGTVTQILPNIARDRTSTQERIVTEAHWSPRGHALLVRLQEGPGTYFGIVQLSRPYTLGAVDPQLEHTPLFGQVSWMPDGRALLRGGAASGMPCDLALVDATSGRVTPLLDGRAQGLCATFPHALPDRAVAFLAAPCDDEAGFRVHLGRLVGGRLVHRPVNQHTCRWPLGVAWAPGGEGLAVEAQVAERGEERQLVFIPLTAAAALPLVPDHPRPQRPCWLNDS